MNKYLKASVLQYELLVEALNEASKSAEEIMDEGDRSAKDYEEKGLDLGAEEEMDKIPHGTPGWDRT